jgi:hypothetical protein
MMDGNENLLENDTSRQDGPEDNLAAIFGGQLPGCDEMFATNGADQLLF